METILSWVKSGLLFGIFASVVLMLSPNKSYQKHIGLVVGFMFLLVMLHPVMKLLSLDQSMYTSYLENFLKLEGMEDDITKSNIALYEESVAMQLEAILYEHGYAVKQVEVEAEPDGGVVSVEITFDGEVSGLSDLEDYLHRVFGEEVRVAYEY